MESLEIKQLRQCFGAKEARQKRLEVRFPLLERSKEIPSTEASMCMGNLGYKIFQKNIT